MTPLQSGAYQSKILSAVVRQTRHWVEQGQSALRRLKTAATWGAQILLYPAYAAVQSVRLGLAQVRLGLELGIPAFRQALRSRAPSSPRSIAPTSDIPLQQTLETVRGFQLPVDLPVVLPIPSVEPAKLEQPKSIVVRTISALRNWTRSTLEAAPHSPATPVPTGGIRGVATLLATRSLVLVTHQNEILDALTPAQQKQLHDRITGAVAVYGRYLKTQSRPLLASSRALVRAVQPLWIKVRSQLHFLAALLHAIVYTVRQMTSRSPIAPQLPGADPAVLPLPLTADLPIQQALRLVQQFSLPAAPGYIRGLACQQDTRSLVLVTDQNQIVDFLSAEQQTHLQQRMAWDTAHYGRYRRIRQQARCAARLQTNDRSPHLLPPVRGLQRLMAWMQRSPVAIAANLFREDSLVLAPAIEPPTLQTVPALQTVSALQTVPTLQTAPPMVAMQWAGALSGSAAASDPLTGFPKFPSSSGAVEPARRGRAAHSPDYIETQATLLGYVQTPIEAVLRWFDRWLLWLEQAIVQVWRWFWASLGTKAAENVRANRVRAN